MRRSQTEVSEDCSELKRYFVERRTCTTSVDGLTLDQVSSWEPMATDMDVLATLVRRALISEDVSAFAELLDPHVTWGAPGARNPTCKSRSQVLTWYERGREAGVRGSVFDVEVLGDRLLVSMSARGTVSAAERGGAALRYQVLSVRDGKIVDIVGFDDKGDALSYNV
jgi:ketosteroid isomerase-like protein